MQRIPTRFDWVIGNRVMACGVAIPILAALLQGCSPVASTTAVTSAPTQSSSAAAPPLQATMDLGVIFQGQTAEMRAWIKNRLDHPLQVARAESSCECLEIRLSPSTIEPKQRTLVHARYDGSKEPDFLGSLRIEAQLLDDKGARLGTIEIPIEVIRPVEG